LAVLAVHLRAFLEKFGGSQVNDRWRARFNELLEEENTLHNTTTTLRARVDEFSRNAENSTVKTAKTQNEGQDFSDDRQNVAVKTAKTPSEAEHLGLIAMWSVEFGYVSLHDPTTGEWHDVRTKEAPSWALWEARKRKELYKDGNRKAYRLTSRDMEDIREAEFLSEPEGIVEDHPIEEEYG
jgi:hypothetical protein